MIFLAFSSLLMSFYLGLITKGYQKKIQKISISNKGWRITKKIFYYSPYVVMLFYTIELSDLLVESCYWILGYDFNSLVSSTMLPFYLISGFTMLVGSIIAKSIKMKITKK